MWWDGVCAWACESELFDPWIMVRYVRRKTGAFNCFFYLLQNVFNVCTKRTTWSCNAVLCICRKSSDSKHWAHADKLPGLRTFNIYWRGSVCPDKCEWRGMPGIEGMPGCHCGKPASLTHTRTHTSLLLWSSHKTLETILKTQRSVLRQTHMFFSKWTGS